MGMSILARAVALITGMVTQRYILLAFGSSLNGLTSSITQVMSYLVLLEAGLGTASIQALYTPLAAGDWKKISGIFTATGAEYRKITALFLALLLAAALLLPLAVAGEVDYVTAGLLTLITGGSYVVSYIMGGKYKAILSADRRMYVLYMLDIITLLLSCILRVKALQMGLGIVFVQTLNLGTILIKNAGYLLYVKRRYKRIDSKASPDFPSISKRWSVLVHHLAGIVVNHTDILILTLFADLKTVSVYSVYNMVFSQLSGMLQSTFFQAPQSSFGKAFNQGMKGYQAMYHAYETLFTILLLGISAIALMMILPFVSIYTRGVADVQYIDPVLPILFCLILLMNQLRTPALMTISVAGAFQDTQKGALIEAAMNLTVSLLLFFCTDLGLYGLLLGTICSYIYRTSDVISFVYHKILGEKATSYIRLVLSNAAVMMLLCLAFYIIRPVQSASYGEWLLNAVAVSGITIIVFMLANLLINRAEIKSLWQYVSASMQKNT